MFCPDTETKECIGSECVAYLSDSKPAIWQCKNCGEKRQVGGDCGCGKRNPVYIKSFPYCKKYKVDL